jgi:hypothetical protein
MLLTFVTTIFSLKATNGFLSSLFNVPSRSLSVEKALKP